ncbi:MAG: hypothetical protein SVY10_10285 [Thermodesulfobacteriota bacterium]|nr:hypothetical protein [Thermodesulfobacteriota bacterium]
MNNNFTVTDPILFSLLLLACLLLLLPNCTSVSSESRINSEPEIEIIVKPRLKEIEIANIGIYYFNSSSRYGNLGSILAKHVRMHLQTLQLMRGVELAGSYNDEDEDPIEIAQQKGYNLILLGYIHEFFYGGLIGDSRVDISMRIIDVQTKATLSYVRGEIDAPYVQSTDCLFFRVKTQEPLPPDVLSVKLIEKLVNVLMNKDIQPIPSDHYIELF